MNHAGLYIHIPFCARKCTYCDFFFSTNTNRIDPFVENLLREIKLQSDRYPEMTFDTLYLGGGTPSVLPEGSLQIIFENLKAAFSFEEDCEITLEANPDDINGNFLETIRKLGVNRLSLGVQSFDDAILKKMNRNHTSSEAVKALEWIREAGFKKWSLDLIHSFPGQTLTSLQDSLNRALSFKPPHLSLYSLTVEEGTPLAKNIVEGLAVEKSNDESAAMMRFAQERLKKAGLLQYELSNFSVSEDQQSRHNSKYWNFDPYLGLGPSAHSYRENKRWWNFSNFGKYEEALQAQKLPVQECETLTAEMQFSEAVMLGLRRKKGLSREVLKGSRYQEVIDRLRDKELIELKDPFISLTGNGFLLYNQVVQTFLEGEKISGFKKNI